MPAQWKDLGKKTKDLFKKQYDYKNEAKVISNAGGVKLESGGYQGKGFTGYTKANWTDSRLGDIEVEAHSCGVAKGQFKKKGVMDGMDVTVAGGASYDLSVESVYSKDSVAATFKVAHNLNKSATNASLNAVVGIDGVSVGAAVELNAADPASPTDYNLGAEYAQKDLVASLITSSKGADLTASYYQNVSRDLQLGGSMLIKPDAGSRLFTFGGEYKLDSATTVKAKADSTGTVCTAVTHNLAKPALKLCLSAQFDALGSDPLAAQKFGCGVEFNN
jgi:hypothetical protein